MRGSEVLHGLIYAMLCRAIERQHRWRVWDETAWWGGGCSFALGSEGRSDESHTFLTLGAVHHAIRITNMQQKEWTERFKHTGENRMYFHDNNAEPIRDARWRTFIPALSHLWWRVIPSRHNQSDSSGSDSLFHRIPCSHPKPALLLGHVERTVFRILTMIKNELKGVK